jgi:hypothetical protein
MNGPDDGLKTIENNVVPQSRVTSASGARDIVADLRQNDLTRGRKRSLVKGLVDGYPPYKATDLKKAGRSDSCNVNWRVAEAYLNSALGAFYDIFHESETYATVRLAETGDSAASDWSRIVTEEFDRLQKRDLTFDYNMQISQFEMVLFGNGPMFFPDEFDWRCEAARCREILVPERARSDVNRWEMCIVLSEYTPTQLYAFIRDEGTARRMGWNVQATRKAIMEANPDNEKSGVLMNWEWHEQELKNNSFNYSMRSKTINVAHLLFQEFPQSGESDGRISHKIVIDPGMSGSEDENTDFLFEKVGRYERWQNVVHPMYYDHGGGGEHHSVTGMGMKMYSAMEYQNRLLCKLADDAFAPRVMFRPTTASDKQKLSLAQYGSYAVLPHNLEVIQQSVQPFIQESLVLNREFSNLMNANLSLYRQFLSEKGGNPLTATEVNQKAGEQARLGATQLNRYYAQLDMLYAERYRRAVNPKLSSGWRGGKEAQEFIERCTKRGVPVEAMRNPEMVSATRVVGNGSPQMRQMALEFLLGMVAMLPESGRANLMRDAISARAGTTAADRYYPVSEVSKLPTDQEAEAMDKVAGMKVGVPPIITSTQNPVIYATTFLKAANDAVKSLEQGGNPAEVLRFMELCVPAIMAHTDRMREDPSRKQIVAQLDAQIGDLSKIADELRNQMQADAQQQQEAAAAQQQAQQIQQGTDPQTMIKAAQAQKAMELAERKTNFNLELKKRKTDLDMALKGMQTAQDLRTKQETNRA